jgi:hypothetical protein
MIIKNHELEEKNIVFYNRTAKHTINRSYPLQWLYNHYDDYKKLKKIKLSVTMKL